MLTVQITRVVPIYPDSVFIQWEIEARDPPAGAGAIEMAVYRSESPAGPWDLISSTPIQDGQFFFVDDLTTPATSNLRALSRNWYYYVRAVNGAEEADSKAVDLLENFEDVLEQRSPLPARFQDAHLRGSKRLILLRRKILRDLWILLEKVKKGWKFAILKRKHYGSRCTNTQCWDPATRQALLQNCPVCHGTGWVDGYYDPFYTIGERRPTPIQEKIDASRSEEEVHRFMFLDYPALAKKDILVDVERNERFCVETVQPTEMQGIRVQQYVTATKLDRVDAVYTLDVDRNAAYHIRMDTRWH